MQVGNHYLKVKRASIGVTQATGLEMGVNAMAMLAGTTSNDMEEGRVLQLLNMVTPEELLDNDDYQGSFATTWDMPRSSALTTNLEILEDIREECEKFGNLLDVKIPRPSMGSRQSAGVGKIFLKYDTPQEAGNAVKNLAGRKFADRTVVATYFSEVRYS